MYRLTKIQKLKKKYKGRETNKKEALAISGADISNVVASRVSLSW